MLGAMRIRELKPSGRLASFVRAFTVVEADEETTRLLVPDVGITLGFRYSGQAAQVEGDTAVRIPDISFAGLRSLAWRVRTSAGGGMIAVAFREGAASRFFREPLHELFGATLSLEDLVGREDVQRIAERIASAEDDATRVSLIEEFLLAREQEREPDALVLAALRAIREARGSIRVGALAAQLGISQDRLEKRFRRVVGSSPRQFAKLVRLRSAIAAYQPGQSLARLAADVGYSDQPHFIREFRSVLGVPPQQFFTAKDRC